MKTFFKPWLIALLVIATLAIGSHFMFAPAEAATDNPSPASSGYQLITIGPFSATATSITGIWEIKAPWPFRVVGFAGHSGAMTNTVSFNLVNSAGVSLLTSALTPSTTAGVVTEATFTTGVSQSITDETMLRIDTATAGTGTTLNTTLQLEIKRL